MVFDALYGPGPTIDSPANTREDLYVPPKEVPALKQVIAGMELKPQNRKQALRAVSAFFQDTNNFRYSTCRNWEAGGDE